MTIRQPTLPFIFHHAYVDISGSNENVLVVNNHEFGMDIHLFREHLITTGAPVPHTVERDVVPNNLFWEFAEDGLNGTEIPFHQHTTQ